MSSVPRRKHFMNNPTDNTPVHDVIATCLPTHSPKTSRTNLKRKWLSHFDFNDGPQAKKARAQPDSVSGRGSSVSSISDGVWRGLPTTMHQNPDSTREEMTIPYVTQPSSHQDSSLDSAPSPPAPSRASAIIVSHLKTSVSTAPVRSGFHFFVVEHTAHSFSCSRFLRGDFQDPTTQ